ncbi:hypothetical protein M8C21_030887, partial [Ambrosia artemisiifolia]
FGDSLADTGNLKQLSSKSNSQPPHFLFPPYGETFFHKPTGRCSNGRLIIDFIAQQSSTTQAFRLKHEYFSSNDVHDHCKNILRNSLILMGEIGGNDYNHAVIAGKPISELKSYVPLVINTIVSSINELIELGAETLVVPGNLPIGCSAAYLTIYYGSDKVEYDNTTGCITELNKFAEWHNELLQTSLNQIREVHPNVNIIYADYYNAAMQFFRSPEKYGFTNGALKACCGGGGPYNYNQLVACAEPSSTTCAQPETYANWDGLHLTEAAYHVIFKSLFQGTYTTPQFNSLCPTSNAQAREASSNLVQSS